MQTEAVHHSRGLDDVREILSKVEGWLSDREVAFLYKTARECSPSGVILEIGSWKGKSTICLAKGSRAGNKVPVYAVDPHIGTLEQGMWMDGRSSYEDFKGNISKAEVEDLLIPVIKRSQEVAETWDKPISLLWIDGDHSYEAAKQDFVLLGKWVLEGGIIAFHDSTQGNLPKLVVECFGAEGFTNVGLIDSVTYATKRRGTRKTTKDLLMLWCLKNWTWLRQIRGIRAIKAPVQRALARLSW